MEEQARDYIQGVIAALSLVDFEAVVKVAEVIKEARERGNTVFTFGNGGSAATASHFQNDLMKMCGVKAVCISDMTPVTLAYGNDNGWEEMFRDVLRVLYSKKDVLVAFSCSGNSMNTYNGMFWGLESGFKVLFTGNDGGRTQGDADFVIKCLHDDIKVQEDVHLAICHCIADLLSDVKT